MHRFNHREMFARCYGKGLVFIIALLVLASQPLAVSAAEPQDSQLFVDGINDYKKGAFPASVDKLSKVLSKYPGTQLRDVTLYWLGRAYYKTGNQQEAARHISQFRKEFPDNPLKNNIEDDLAAMVTRFERGEKLPTAAAPGKPALTAEEMERLAREKQAEEAEAARRLAAEKLAAAKAAAEKAAEERIKAEREAAERLAAAKAAEERLRVENAEIVRLSEAKATEQIAAATAAAAKAEAERQAAEANRLAVEKSAGERLAAALAAVDKAEAERRAAEKAAQEYRAAAEMALKVAESAKKAAAEHQEAAAKALKVAEEAKKSAVPVPVPMVTVVNPAPELVAATEKRLAEERAAREKAEATLKAERAAREKLAQDLAAAERRAAELMNVVVSERAKKAATAEKPAPAQPPVTAPPVVKAGPALPAAPAATSPQVALPRPVEATPPQGAKVAVESPAAVPTSAKPFSNSSSAATPAPTPAPVKKPVEFADLPPALQSELEFLCFQAKAKGKFQFNECIKAQLENR